jgi:hypothetical protein
VRAGCGMSRVGTWAAWARQGSAQKPEPPILAAAVFAAAADSAVLMHLQRLDDSWLRLMVSGRTAPVTAIAKVFNVLGWCT